APEPEGVDIAYLGLRTKPYKALTHVVPGRLGFPDRERSRLARHAPRADLQLATYSLTAAPAASLADPVLYHVQHFEPLIVPRGRPRRLALESYRLEVYRTANCKLIPVPLEGAGRKVGDC